MLSKINNKKGFTLIETCLTASMVLIISFLAAVNIPDLKLKVDDLVKYSNYHNEEIILYGELLSDPSNTENIESAIKNLNPNNQSTENMTDEQISDYINQSILELAQAEGISEQGLSLLKRDLENAFNEVISKYEQGYYN